MPCPKLMPTAPEFSLVQTGMHFDPSRGGADRYFAELLRALGEAGVACQAAAFGNPPPDSPHRLTSLGPDDSPLPARLTALRRYGRTVLPPGIPSVFAWHFALYGGAALPRFRRCGAVAHFHGPWGDESAAEGAPWPVVAAKRWIERRVLRRAHRVVVLSPAFRDLAMKRLGVPPERIEVIPPSIDLDRFHPVEKEEARRVLGWPEHGPVVFCLRRMVHRMGLEELISAWESVSRHIPEATLVLAGSGPLLPDLEARTCGFDTGGHPAKSRRILFTGRLEDKLLPLAYSAATVSVVPSRSLEGFGLVALESLACGTPALVTPVGGLPGVVSGLDPGLVLESSEPEAIASGLIRALASPGALPEVSACREYASGTFSAAQLAARVLAVYGDALKESLKK